MRARKDTVLFKSVPMGLIIISMSICGDSTVGSMSLFQSEDGGSIPTSPHQFKIGECTFNEVRSLFERFHYKAGHMGGGITTCLALYMADYSLMSAMGGAVLGALRQEQAYKDKGRTIEIRRMACDELAPKNTESYFLSKVIWWIKKNKMADSVISYADQSVGHKGTIYKAANFKLIGESAATMHVFWNGVRYHPRSLSIDRPYSHKLRAAIETGEAKLEKGQPKLIFEYKI